MEKLVNLCKSAFTDYDRDFDYSKEKVTLSVEIRINLVSIIRMLIRYGKHLGGFKIPDGKPDFPEDLARITYLEAHAGTEL